MDLLIYLGLGLGAKLKRSFQQLIIKYMKEKMDVFIGQMVLLVGLKQVLP